MQLLVNGRRAAIKPGSSFDYVAENPLFSGSEDYTLAITLPMAGCSSNLSIFGHLNRADVYTPENKFDAELRCGAFVKYGVVTVTHITDKEIKVQFLAGKSVQNFDKSFDDIYIDELRLGFPEFTKPSQISPNAAMDPAQRKFESVALPWVNNNSGILHNAVSGYGSASAYWKEPSKDLSWQPYLYFIAKKICEVCGYSYDFRSWLGKPEYRYLVSCNVLPPAWDLLDYARALPHWTVAEFFEKLESFMRCDFRIDHKFKSVTCSFLSDMIAEAGTVALDNVVDEFSVQISESKSSCNYIESRSYKYKDCDANMWKYYVCPNFIKVHGVQPACNYDTVSQLVTDLRDYINADSFGLNKYGVYAKLYYAKSVDMHFIIRAYDYTSNHEDPPVYSPKFKLQPVNIFGGDDDGDESAKSSEIEFVPVILDHTDIGNGFVIFLQSSAFDEATDPAGDDSSAEDDDEEKRVINQTYTPIQKAVEGDSSDSRTSGYFDCIYFGYWDGKKYGADVSPHPYVENLSFNKNYTAFEVMPFNYRIKDATSENLRPRFNLDKSRKVSFRFLADNIPDVRSVFQIRGRRYLCEKITATFSDAGMSQLMKGEFWPILD